MKGALETILVLGLPPAAILAGVVAVRRRKASLSQSPMGRELLRTVGVKDASVGRADYGSAAVLHALIAVGCLVSGRIVSGIGDQFCCDGSVYTVTKVYGWGLVALAALFGLSMLTQLGARIVRGGSHGAL